MAAGSFAGVIEHVVMYPVDTIKTRMQVAQANAPRYKGVFQAAAQIARVEGVHNLYCGLPAVVAAAIPSHAVYFAVYEVNFARCCVASLKKLGRVPAPPPEHEHTCPIHTPANAHTTTHDAPYKYMRYR
jgi:hypothetical protein